MMTDPKDATLTNPYAGNPSSLSLIESAEESLASQREALAKARVAYELSPTTVNKNAVRWWEGEIRRGIRIINGMRERNGLGPMDDPAEVPDAPSAGPCP